MAACVVESQAAIFLIKIIIDVTDSKMQTLTPARAWSPTIVLPAPGKFYFERTIFIQKFFYSVQNL